MSTAATDRVTAPAQRLVPAALALGFALGGFFDGILLHQILQWHHLLSGLDGSAFDDLRLQILADGLFHLVMYLIAAAGLWLLWRARHELAAAGAERRLIGTALIGFGAWHIVDAVLSHWLLGLHRIRMDTASPLLWDLIWLTVFGVVPIIAGWLINRSGADGGSAGRSRHAASAILVLTIVTTGPVAALPPPGATGALALFAPGTTLPQVAAAADASGGRVIAGEPSGELWAIDLDADAGTLALYRHGAIAVSRSFLPVGCIAWLRG